MKNQYDFCDEYTLAETAENLAKKAVKLGLIQSFVVRVFADSWQFYIPKENESEPLTPEQAYLYLKRLVEQAIEEDAPDAGTLRTRGHHMVGGRGFQL